MKIIRALIFADPFLLTIKNSKSNEMPVSVKPFAVYRSSAGSGKTRSLAKEYLKLALEFRSDYFKRILAVTFTNKATQEMKDRILLYLTEFSSGQESELSETLQKELKL